MSVTINDVEDAIIAALTADTTIAGWKASVLSADDAARLGQQTRGRYPLYGVIYNGAPDPDGPLAGGSGGGAMFARRGRFSVYAIDKNLRGEVYGRKGDALGGGPGIYAMTEAAIRVLGYKDFGLAIARLEYAGDQFIVPEWDELASGQIIEFTTQWETTCMAD
jgi:hypothetical protein